MPITCDVVRYINRNKNRPPIMKNNFDSIICLPLIL